MASPSSDKPKKESIYSAITLLQAREVLKQNQKAAATLAFTALHWQQSSCTFIKCYSSGKGTSERALRPSEKCLWRDMAPAGSECEIYQIILTSENCENIEETPGKSSHSSPAAQSRHSPHVMHLRDPEIVLSAALVLGGLRSTALPSASALDRVQ
ncbi:hypothetical protein JB92DRAFT_2832768 [Gautieria morchelliformis]|nr:hypothetical protein JB92DRAFT_2832768 [Gautieria morchelliformis]